MGCPHPDFLPLDANQFCDWQEFWQTEPFGDEWRQTALQAFTTAAAAGAKNITIDDFMPIAREPDSDEQLGMELESFFQIHNANPAVTNG